MGPKPRKSAPADGRVCEWCGRPHVRTATEFVRETSAPGARVCRCDECGCRPYLLKIAALGRDVRRVK